MAATICLSLVFVTHALRGRYFWLKVPGTILLLVAVFLGGFWRAGETYVVKDARFFASQYEEGTFVGGRIKRIRPGENSLRAEVDVVYLYKDSTNLPVKGRLLLYLPPDIKSASVRAGDRVVFRGRLDTLRGPLNPGSFDGKAYWATQGIYHRIYLRDAGDWRHIRVAGWGVAARAEKVRRAWFKSFQHYLTGDELAVAAALIIGQKDLLTTDIRSAYSDTGAMHVLAVSGLHVGIIFLIVQLLFKFTPLRTNRYGRIVETLITIAAIWLFAFVSGLSPSVQRAAIMFTVVASGRIVLRDSYLINTLAAAALIMLWWEPDQIMQVGFQLSFMALVGIVWFAGPLQRWLPGRGRVVKTIKSGVAASVGAQLGTLPVGLYVFRSFPLYFVLSGSAVVIFAYLAMCVGVLHGVLYAIAGFSWATEVTGWLLGRVVETQNAFIYFFSRLPGGVYELRSFPLLSSLLVALGLVALAAAVHYRRWMAWMLSVLLFVGAGFYARSRVPGDGRAATLTVYHLRGKSLVDYRTASASVAVGDEVDPLDLNFNVAPNRKMLGYDSVALTAIDTSATFQFGKLNWVVLDKERTTSGPAMSPGTNHLLVRNGFRPKDFPTDDLPVELQIIVDGSNPAYLNDDWQAFAEQRGLAVWITGVRGAYVWFE